MHRGLVDAEAKSERRLAFAKLPPDFLQLRASDHASVNADCIVAVNAKRIPPQCIMHIMETPADRLRQARIKKGIETAVEAADRMQMSRTTYQNYEDGSRGFSRHIVKISRFYGVRPQWLLAGIPPMMTSDFEEKLNALSPDDQAKAWEYLEMLAAKQRRT